MDFDFTEAEESFRKEVRSWLERNLPDDLRGRSFAASRGNREEFVRLRWWQNKLYEAGYVGMDWPRAFGGRGASLTEMVILYQEMGRAESPQIVNRGGVSNIWVRPLDGGAPRQLTKFNSEQIFWFDWSTDGQQLGVSRGAVTSDVVMMKDLRARTS